MVVVVVVERVWGEGGVERFGIWGYERWRGRREELGVIGGEG